MCLHVFILVQQMYNCDMINSSSSRMGRRGVHADAMHSVVNVYKQT